MTQAVRVLFVDDDPVLRKMWSTVLGAEGYEVTMAASVPEALALISRGKFQVLIADLNVGQPGDGFTIVSAMRRTQPEVTTLILTGYPAFQAALRAIHEQVDDFLVKPADPQKLLATIRRNLGHRREPASVAFERLDTVIAKNKESIIDEWYETVERDPEINRIVLPRDQRIDDLPQVMDDLVRVAPAGELINPRSRSAAAKHGALRRRQGYTTPLLMEETRILYRVIANCMEKNLLSVDLSKLIPDLLEMHDRLLRMLRVSVEAFLQEGVPQAV